MNENKKIAIVGAGKLGQAIGKLLVARGASVRLWDVDTTRVPDQGELKDIVPSANFVMMCVPSWGMRPALLGVVPFLSKDATLVSFSKGIEEGTLYSMAELFAETVPAEQATAVIGGPMLADEISAGKKAMAVFASKNGEARSALTELFSGPDFGVELSDDLGSVALAGVLKNVYAVSLGIADGLELSGNEKGWIASLAIREMVGIGTLLGAQPGIIMGTAGVGDFIATGYSPYSRNRQVGDEIVKFGTCSLRGEGLNALPLLMKKMGDGAATFPLLNLIKETCIDCQPAAPAFEAFFTKSFALKK